MKRVFLILLAGCIVCGLLSGCGGGERTPNLPPSEYAGFTSTPARGGETLHAGDLTVSLGSDPNELELTWGSGRYSTAASEQEAQEVKGTARLGLRSLVTGSYYDLELKKETEFYTANPEVQAARELLTDGSRTVARVTFSVREGLSFSVDVELENGRLILRIPREQIHETERLVFKRLRLAPNLLSAGADAQGYFLLPDGCGGLMRFGSGKQGVYDEAVYGVNRAFIYEAYAVSNETVRLPVYGMEREGDTVLAVITSGAACARIRAATNGNESPRNRAYCAFLLREEDAQYITEDAFQTVIQPSLELQADLEVTYLFGTGDGGYSEMARLLREYLCDEGTAVKPPESCVLLSIYGAVEQKRKVLSIPLYDTTGQITTAQTAKEIVQSVDGWMDGAPMVRLAAWDENAVRGYSVGSFDPAGSEKSLRELVEFCRGSGCAVYLSAPLATFRRSGNGVSLKRDAIRNLAGQLSCQYTYYRASNAANTDLPARYYLDGGIVPGRAEKLAASLESWSFSGVAVEDIAGVTYANYRENAPSGQDATEAYFRDALDILGQGRELLLEDGNFYALSSGVFVYNAPDSGSKFELLDAEVPFYQMVLSGIKGYAGDPVNRVENRNRAYLKALETGACIHYELVGENTGLQGTDLEALCGGDWNRQQALIRQEIEAWQADLERVVGATIVRHEILAENVTRTTYENGWVVTVNVNDYPVQVDGAEIGGESYRMERGQAE